MEYAELLKNAPLHLSPEFLIYLKQNNRVVKELKRWLIIENFKYHAPHRPWHTAFFKLPILPQPMHMAQLFRSVPHGWCMMVKDPKEQSVMRYHVHIFKP